MRDYWQCYLEAVAAILATADDLYAQLYQVFGELEVFIGNFRQYWLTPELYGDQALVDGGLQQETLFIEQLIDQIAARLTREAADSSRLIRLGARETAVFITMNFITMVQMPLFRYPSFELFLKELLK